MTLALAIIALVVAGAILFRQHRQKERIMAAIDDLNTAITKVGAYLTSLQAGQTDLTPQIEAATAALNALVPPAVVADPAPAEPVVTDPTSDPIA